MNNLRHYYIDEVSVIVDSGLPENVIVTGSGIYEPNQVKRYAENMLRESNPNSKITSIILSHKNVTLEEYQAIIGKNPSWLGNIEN
ncbi:hypothetical protein [Flavobacterium panici]|uniref:Uncharacterized protein n=1 Tax=Flavobacterium panici TaxID=2654843 RepID=A0A9N8J5S8_9FLAO|nr:hypothetical protein [Flavobacterium panici]CAC9976795.1 hypothetical protein FLAPXU55_04523 [Flavobacterium panici]